MKMIILLLLPFIFSCNSEKVKIRKVAMSAHKDQFYVSEVGGVSLSKEISFLVSNDTAYAITPSVFGSDTSYMVEKFFFKKSDTLISFISKKVGTSVELKEYYLLETQAPYFFTNFNNLGLRYKAITADITKILLSAKIILDQPRMITTGNHEYLLDRLFPKLYVFSHFTKQLYTHSFVPSFMEVTDFFTYDLNKDGKSELFIFHIGDIPRENAIGLRIFTVRTP
jgi:hypothetical protein